MKKLLARLLRALLAAAVALVAFVAISSLPWRKERAEPPRVVAAASSDGPLVAGAAEVRFELPERAPIAGFARLSWESEGVRDPVAARALVLLAPGLRVALASAEILLVPAELEAEVRRRTADLGLDGVLLAATHTHAGPGGYWRNVLGERLGAAPYQSAMNERIAAGIAEAIRRAAAAAAPARLEWGTGRAEGLVRNRSGGVTRDGRLTVVRAEGAAGRPIAELVIFAAHPTLLGRRNRLISGDWPGPFVAEGRRGVRLLFQGALGDQATESPPGSVPAPESYAALVSRAVDGVVVTPLDRADLGYAEAEIALPLASPGALPAFLRPAARNLASGLLPAHARVAALRLGPLVLLAVPAEPVADVGAAWRRTASPGAEIVGVAGGYLGYVERPERIAAREGEAVRTYFGPELAKRLQAGLLVAEEAASRGRGLAPTGLHP